jgi:hypothetical protein
MTVKRLIALKTRQCGITWLAAAYVLWRAIFHANELIVIISAKEDLAVEFLDRVKFIFDRLPSYLKPRVYKRTNTELTFGFEEKDPLGNIMLSGLGSSIKSLPSTPDAGQSKTVTLLVMDETALNRYNREIWSAAEPTLEHSAGQAILISNPTKDGPGWPWTRKIYTDSMKGLNDFGRIFLSWMTVPGRNTNPEDPLYFITVQKRKGLDDTDISKQYPTTEDEAIAAATGGYFGSIPAKFKPMDGVNGNLHVTEKNVVQFEESPRRKGILEIWRWPKKNWKNRYCIGSDVGEGLGGNYSVAYVYDRHLQEVVARIRTNQVDADKWARELMLLGVYYYNAKIGIERNGPGISTIFSMQNARKYHNLYVRRKPGRTKGSYTSEIGWLTTDESKQVMCSHLKSYMRDVFPNVPCVFFMDECSSFVQIGEWLGPEEGAFSDCIMALGITLQVSRETGECMEISEEKEKGWREQLWGDPEIPLRAYDVTTM